MTSPRKRAVLWSSAGLATVWLLAICGYMISGSLRVTGEKVRVYVEAVDLSKLSPADRAAALKRLADMINKLSFEERQQTRLGRTAEKWFLQMTEEERGEFIEATLATGF